MTEKQVDISVVISFHDEGQLAKPSLQSLIEMVEFSNEAGCTVEILVALDRATMMTTKIVNKYARNNWNINITDFGDPGLVRNHLITKASGLYISVLDGDDLWSPDWLSKAHVTAQKLKSSVLHPEFAYYFYESDFDVHSPNSMPHQLVKSHFVRHQRRTPTSEALIEVRLNNPWSAHCFASREIFEAIPYRADEKESGIGIEDWTFNAEVLHKGFSHDVVLDTVHMLRQRLGTSQNTRNSERGMLPDFSRLGDWRIGEQDEA